MEQSELPEKITALIKAAEDGDATAQYDLGYRYRRGQGVEQSNSKALYWYQKSAEQDNPFGQNAMGGMYQKGWGVEKDESKAIHWFTKSAEQGLDIAQYHLGNMYLDIKEGVGNDIKAAYWYRKSARQGNADAQCNLGWMYDHGRGVKQSDSRAAGLYIKASKNGSIVAKFNLAHCYIEGKEVKQSYSKALDLFREVANSNENDVRFEAIEMQDEIERIQLSGTVTNIRSKILKLLRVNSKTTPTMTHYTSLSAGMNILFKKSPLRLGHISSLNDPNEGKLLWNYLGHIPVENKPVFVGCFLPSEDSLNMWRFYSKNHNNDDACGCAITFKTEGFFSFDLLKTPLDDAQQKELRLGFSNTGKSPQESARFYRIIYVDNDMNFYENDKGSVLEDLFKELKREVSNFLGESPNDERLQELSKLMGPLPYLLKDVNYKAEEEHRIIVTHLEYGSSEIQVQEPEVENGMPKTAPKLYLELNRTNHLDQIKHVTLGPKAPHREMLAPYWHHKLFSDFSEPLKTMPGFYVRTSKCAYK